MPANPRRVLFVCTGNAARSQIAHALLNRKGLGRFAAESAGAKRAARVHPFALDVLQEIGIDWSGHEPRDVAGLEREPWDLVITVCDPAKEACAVFLGQTAVAHWGLPDPTEVEGDDQAKRAAFRASLRDIDRRLDHLLALPWDQLQGPALAAAVNALARD